jgi:hypothetical protein
MRKLILSLGISSLSVALLRIALAPLFLAEPADRATVLLLASGVFTIAVAAVVRA